MVESHFGEWLELALRWAHLAVGIAWIGASFYFNWLENRLQRGAQENSALEGDLWAIHGGGFYHIQKYEVAPDKLPAELHWFKWEAYFTWFTGLALLVLVFYLNARVYLLDASIYDLTPLLGTIIGVGSLIVSWIFYDRLCASPVNQRPRILAAIVFVYFSLLAFVLCQMFSGRGAYVHVGAAIGTIMVLNVMAVIIPSQKALVNAMKVGGTPDAELGKAALTRSRHNNYLTLPVLVIMISSHYPSTFSGSWNWLVLIGLGIVGILVRHYFNVRHLAGPRWWLLLAALIVVVGIAFLTVPKSRMGSDELQSITIDSVRSIIHERCTVCHSAAPIQPGFQIAPGGIVLDTDDQITQLASRIFTAAVATRSMPIGNLSKMTDEERQLISSWYAELNKTAQTAASP